MAMMEMSAGIAPASEIDAADGHRVSLTETWWGYVIRTERRVTSAQRILRAVAAGLAICFAVAGAAVWIAPIQAVGGPEILLKGGVSSLLAMLALVLSRLSELPPMEEVQVDCRRAELRQFERRRGDRGRLVARYAFEEIGGVFLDRGASSTRLLARYRNTPHVVTVATGPGPRLERMRDRLGRDLLGAPLSS